MRPISPPLMRALLATTGLAIASAAHAQSATATTASNTRPTRAASNYSTREADFVVGRAVYLRSSKTPVGRIEAEDASHEFPRSFPHSPAKAVLIRRDDGPRSWMPLAGITRIYVVGK